MITEDLKSTVDGLSRDQRHELTAYLTKLQLENDPDYWKTIRERVGNSDSERWVSANEL
ncbi:hypothetical protein N9891_01605 [bacterium]|nr:hypothetical protein [bacterium]